jgi:DNA-binding NarL/FixJ family response regulator
MRQALVVDDVDEARAWLGQALREAFPGIEVTTVAALAEARSLSATFDIALVDLSLLDGSGVDLIAEIKHEAPTTVCIASTLYDDDGHIFPALQAGADGYLLKDLPQAQFSQRLQGIARGEPPLSPAVARRLLSHFNAPPPSNDTGGLSPREREVLAIIAKGVRLPEAAKMLGISHHTVAGYVKDIYRKLNISSRAEATLEATRLGLVRPN